MLSIKKTEKVKNILNAIKIIFVLCLFFQIPNYFFSIIAIILNDEKDKFYFLTLTKILICNLVVPAGLTILMIITYTFIMIFVYLVGSFDDLKIQIIDEYDENNENNIYSPFNIYFVILMGIVFFWMFTSPLFAGMFIWCWSVLDVMNHKYEFLIAVVSLTSLSGVVLLLVQIISICAISRGCFKYNTRHLRYLNNYRNSQYINNS